MHFRYNANDFHNTWCLMSLIEKASSAEPVLHTSTLMLQFESHFTNDRVTIFQLANWLGDRSFGFLLVFFALPNVLPIALLPGISILTGVPLTLLALQLVFGFSKPYLPNWIGTKSFSRHDFKKIIDTAVPWLQKMEFFMKPRLLWLSGPYGKWTQGLFCFVLASVLTLPIPFGNILPASAIILLALGLIEKDGLCILLGGITGIISIVVVAGVIWAMITAAILFVQHILLNYV